MIWFSLILLSLLMVGCNVVSQEQSQYIEQQVLGEWCLSGDEADCIEITYFYGLYNYTDGTESGECMIEGGTLYYLCNVKGDVMVIEFVTGRPTMLSRKSNINKLTAQKIRI